MNFDHSNDELAIRDAVEDLCAGFGPASRVRISEIEKMARKAVDSNELSGKGSRAAWG